MISIVKGRLVPFAVSFTVSCLFFINVCDLIFGCGCRSLWSGADAMCNVHLSASRHCPFCSRGVAGYAAIMTLVSAPQFAVSMWTQWSRAARIVVCLLLFPAAMLVVGLAAGAYDGYW
jgi:hypothetical protein